MKNGRCTVCNHKDVLAINRELVLQASPTVVSQKYSLSPDAVWRHKQAHISRQLAKAYQMKEQATSIDLLSKIDGLLEKGEILVQRNFDVNRDALAIKAMDSLRSTLDLLARISFQLHQAKMAEFGNDKDTIIAEYDESKKLGYKSQLNALSVIELSILNMINSKLISGDANLLIFPDNEPMDKLNQRFQNLIPWNIKHPELKKSFDHAPTKLTRTKGKNTQPDNKNQTTGINHGLINEEIHTIKQVEPILIPSGTRNRTR